MSFRKLILGGICGLGIFIPAFTSRAQLTNVALTPPMGFNSFYSYGDHVSEALIESIADAMATNGMLAAGYQYLNIDDGWEGLRDTNGVISADTIKFPDGMPATVNYLHAKGFKVGIYTVAGTNTCAEHPGSYDHLVQDINTFASWGIDYLKYEGCEISIFEITARQQIYAARVNQALAHCGRPMVFSCSVQGFENWMPQYINLWRGTGDSGPGWDNVLHHIDYVSQTPSFAGPNRWNDMDVMEIGSGFFNDTEVVSIFSMWSILTSPLLAITDGTNHTDVLCNSEAIAVDQDPAGIQGTCVSSNNNLQVFRKPLGAANSTNLAVVLFNRGPDAANITANWSDLGLPPGVATLRDLWAHAYTGTFTNSYTASIAGHGAQMLKLVYDTTLPRPPVGTNFLSHLAWLADITNNTPLPDGAPLALDMSSVPGPLKMHGVIYTNGLGMNVYTRLSYFMGAAASRFQASIGVDDAAGGFGILDFRVYADGTKIYDSGTVSNGTPTQSIDLDVSGRNILTLESSYASSQQLDGYADWANARIIVQSLPPTVPGGLTAVAATNQITLSWDASYGAVSYNVERSSTSGGPYTTNANVLGTTYTDTNVTPGAIYYYVVAAVNAVAPSAVSSEAVGAPVAYWTNTITSAPQNWNLGQNWSNSVGFPNRMSANASVNNNILANQNINLNQPITLGLLSIGAAGGSAAYTVAANGGSLIFDNGITPAQLIQLSNSAGDTIAAAITLKSNFTIVNNSANVLTLSGNISAPSFITLTGPGPVLLAGANSFATPLNVSQGKLIIGNNTALGTATGGVILSGKAALDLNGFNLGVAPVTILGAGSDGLGSLISDAATPQTNALQKLTLAGDATLGGTARWDLRGTSSLSASGTLSATGQPYNLTKVGGNEISLASITVDPALANIDVQQGVLNLEFATTSLGNPTNALTVESGATVAFNQTTTSWNKLFVLNGDGLTTTVSNNSGANTVIGPVTLNGNCLFGVAGGVLALNGPITGSGCFTKILGNQLTLAGTNSYSGNTYVNTGTLAIANANSLTVTPGIEVAAGAVLDTTLLGAGLTLASGQTLGGSGFVKGHITVGNGATLSPSNSFGVLTFSNALTIASGGVAHLAVSHSPATNELVRVLGTLTYGGTLNLTNLSASSLAAGDVFKLFDASTYVAGSMKISPQTPGPSLVWDTSSLINSGIVRVAAGITPRFAGLTVNGNKFSASGTGGVTNGTYYVLSSTNSALPAAQWTRIATNHFDAAGNFTITNSISVSVPATFYLLQLP